MTKQKKEISKPKIEIAKKPKKTNRYDPILGNFLHNLNLLSNLNIVLPKSIDAYRKQKLGDLKNRMKSLNESGRKELSRWINFFQESIKEKSRGQSINFKNKDFIEILLDDTELDIFHSESKIFIREMSLTYLITCFEEFIRSTLRIAFEKCPSVLKSSKKHLTYEELLEYKEIDDIKKSIIEKEIDSIMYRDIDGINDYLKTPFGLDLSVVGGWNLFKERFYRRNIVIHNNCFPNKTYRKKTNYRGKHKRLSISKQYLSDSHKLFEEFSKQIYRHFKEKFS